MSHPLIDISKSLAKRLSRKDLAHFERLAVAAYRLYEFGFMTRASINKINGKIVERIIHTLKK